MRIDRRWSCECASAFRAPRGDGISDWPRQEPRPRRTLAKIRCDEFPPARSPWCATSSRRTRTRALVNEGANALDFTRSIVDNVQAAQAPGRRTWGIMGIGMGFSVAAAVVAAGR